MKSVMGVLGALAVFAGFMAAMGALGAWALQRVLPWTGTYGRAALWGMAELGFVGLTFVASIRNRVGAAVFLATLPVGALWGLTTLGVLRLCGAAPRPYAFSIAFSVSALFLGFAVAFAVAGATRKTQA